MGEKITRDDIEKKIRDVQASVEADVSDAKSIMVPVAIAGAVVLLGITYALGRRAGRKKSMVLEVRSR